MTTRRRFLWAGAAAGAGAFVTNRLGIWPRVLAQVAGGTLSPSSIPKFTTSLFIPPAMPRAGSDLMKDVYTVGMRQFAQQILPPAFPQTDVWGYGSLTNPATFHYPSPSFEVRA